MSSPRIRSITLTLFITIIGLSFATWGLPVQPTNAQDAEVLSSLLATYTLRDGEDSFSYVDLAAIDVSIDGPSADNCAVPIMAMGGQAYHVGGADGGLDVLPIPARPTPYTTLFDWTQPQVKMTLGQRTVVVLIVDQFGTDSAGDVNASLEANVFDPAIDQATLDALYTGGTLTHGQLVFNHANSQLAFMGLQPEIVDVGGIRSVRWQGSNSFGNSIGNSIGGIYVVPVDALQYGGGVPPTPTSLIAQQIQNAIVAIANDPSVNMANATVIVNTSFAIMPCNVAEHFAIASLGVNGSFVQYMKVMTEQDAMGNGPLWQQTAIDMITVSDQDPLLMLGEECASVEEPSASADSARLLALPQFARAQQDCPNVGAIHFVASSGNSSLPFPYYPAASAPFICAQDWYTPDMATGLYNEYYSNDCQSVDRVDTNDAPPFRGGYYALIDPWHINEGWSTLSVVQDTIGSNIAYLGTSFVAPSQGVLLAIEESNR